MKSSLFLLALLLCAALAHGQQTGTGDAGQRPGDVSRQLGRFNYTYLRFAYLRPSSGFSNPLANVFPGSEKFTLRDDVPNSFGLGFESGKVRHINKLNLGTGLVKLGINSGIALQAFGAGSIASGTSTASTIGTYLFRLGLGPQATFKPIEEVRIGVYYRAGLALVYSAYAAEERTAYSTDQTLVDKVDVQFMNRVYNGDFGLDVSYRSLAVGLSISAMRTRPAKGALVDFRSFDEEANAVTTTLLESGQSDVVSTKPIDPLVHWRRIGISIGFAL